MGETSRFQGDLVFLMETYIFHSVFKIPFDTFSNSLQKSIKVLWSKNDEPKKVF